MKMESCSNIAFVGSYKVGKMCLITQLIKKSLPEKNSPTIKTMFRYEIQTSADSCTTLEILETADYFEFPNMLKKAVGSCYAFVLVFDLSNPMQTFEEIIMLRQLIIEEKGRGHAHAPIIVIGNKKDLVYGQDSIDNKILDAIVSNHWGCRCITTSAQCDVNISDVNKAVCKELKIKIKQSLVVGTKQNMVLNIAAYPYLPFKGKFQSYHCYL